MSVLPSSEIVRNPRSGSITEMHILFQLDIAIFSTQVPIPQNDRSACGGLLYLSGQQHL
jgi:hypothetical protein